MSALTTAGPAKASLRAPAFVRRLGRSRRLIIAIGAFLAIPIAGSDPVDYKVVRDLSRRPANLLTEDVGQIQSIFWRDEKPESVRSMMAALGLDMKVDHFVVFLPHELEERLYRLEHDHRGRKEDEIAHTIFRIRLKNARYEPYVASQAPKR